MSHHEDVSDGGKALSTEASQAFACPFCERKGLTEATLQEHVNSEHPDTSTETVCPVCASIPGGSKKQVHSARKEFETMVVKYATSQREVMMVRKAKDETEKRLRDVLKDKESLGIRIKGLSHDKTGLLYSLDRKIAEAATHQKDAEKLREELKETDSKWKQSQLKVKVESDSHQETKRRLDKMSLRIEELELEITHLKGANSELLVEMESCRHKDGEMELQLKLKLESESHQETSRQLDAASLRIKELEHETLHLNKANLELVSEMESFRHKEGELLEFTERLTTKTVQLQSDHSTLEQKCATLSDEFTRISGERQELASQKDALETQMLHLRDKHALEVTSLAKKVAEKSKVIEELRRRLEENENELRIVKKRHLSTTKELSILKKRLDNFENQEKLPQKAQTYGNPDADAESISSRTSSSNSLDAINSQHNHRNSNHVQQPSQASKIVNGQVFPSRCTSRMEMEADIVLPELDKQMLVNKIIRLQKTLNESNARIDFLEEHCHQLVEQMKRKRH